VGVLAVVASKPTASAADAAWSNVARDRAMHEEGGGVDSSFSSRVPGDSGGVKLIHFGGLKLM
jgi:hypothetical protein